MLVFLGRFSGKSRSRLKVDPTGKRIDTTQTFPNTKNKTLTTWRTYDIILQTQKTETYGTRI